MIYSTVTTLVFLVIPLIGVWAQIPTPVRSFPWGLQGDQLPRTELYDSWRQKYQREMTATRAPSVDNLINYATPYSNYNPLISRYNRPNGKYDHFVYNQNGQHPQNVYRYPMVMYDGVSNYNNRGVVDVFANALGIKLPFEINVRDTIDEILKFGQRVGIIRVYPSNSNMYFPTENYVPDKVRNDYVQKPLSDFGTPTSFIQFNVIQLDGMKMADNRPEQGGNLFPVSTGQSESEYRPDYSHTNCAQADPNRRVIQTPLPYWMTNEF